MKILIVDDEPELLEHITYVLKDQNYCVDTAVDGSEALDRLYGTTYDLVVLDIMLPKIDGLAVLKQIREAQITTPVLILSAKGEVKDKTRGLDLGADDYLAKPFAKAELLARIRSMLRRAGTTADPLLKVVNVELNTITRQVSRNEEPIDLTPKEFCILEFLLYNKNRTVSRFTLAEHVWGDEFDPFTMSNFIDVHINNLRKKISPGNSKPLIRTIRGVGFIVEDGD